jgi:hypothetical protein
MEVFYTYFDVTEEEGKHRVEKTQIMPMRGGLRGKGKKDVWIDPGCLVVIAETGLGGMTHEIVAVFAAPQISRLRRVKTDLDPRLFLQEGGTVEDEDGGILIAEEEEGDLNVEDI